MKLNSRRHLILLSFLTALSGCAVVENDLRKGLNYGLDTYQLTKKVDEKNARRVNVKLWRAAVDTVGYLPMGRLEPSAGQIETAWYSSPGAPKERSKLKVEILLGDLRPDALRVTSFREVWMQGAWVPTAPGNGVAQKLEEQIYQKARFEKVVR